MGNPSPLKLKSISILFLAAGLWGIFMGLFYFKEPNFFVSALGIVNISLGIFLAFRTLRKSSNQVKGKK